MRLRPRASAAVPQSVPFRRVLVLVRCCHPWHGAWSSPKKALLRRQDGCCGAQAKERIASRLRELAASWEKSGASFYGRMFAETAQGVWARLEKADGPEPPRFNVFLSHKVMQNHKPSTINPKP